MYTVVVADDEEELRKGIIRRMDWENIGFQVVGEAENGIEALEMVEKMQPDLLLTDIRMPFVSGIELARQVREIRPATQIAFLSGFDEFSYAQQAIQYNIISYMLKPITMSDLRVQLQEIKKKIDHIFEEFESRKQELTNVHEFVMPLLLDSFGKTDDMDRERQMQERAFACGLIRNRNHSFQYVVLAVSLQDAQGQDRTSAELVHSIDMILKKYVGYYSFYMEGRIVSLLLATKGAFEKYLHIMVKDIVQSAERILGLKCIVGVSRMQEHLVECHEAYSDAMGALGYGRVGESGIHYIMDEERMSTGDMAGIQEMVAELENLIRSGTREELEGYLEKMFCDMGEEHAQIKLRILMIQMMSSVFRIVHAVTNEITMLQKFYFSKGSYQELKEQFTELCIEAKEVVSAGKKKSSQVLCEQAMHIIEKEYADAELSLISVSSRINVSPNYLSALIKKETGMSFIDSLTRKRIETARELVMGTSMKVREISERCGYNDQHYFSYCFKKYCGVSPNLMRQQMQTGEI